jgi:hypothetical protein
VTLSHDSEVQETNYEAKQNEKNLKFTANFLTGFVGVALGNEPIVKGQVNSNYDPSFGGIFSTQKPYSDPDEWNQPEDRQDQWDWKLSKVGALID